MTVVVTAAAVGSGAVQTGYLVEWSAAAGTAPGVTVWAPVKGPGGTGLTFTDMLSAPATRYYRARSNSSTAGAKGMSDWCTPVKHDGYAKPRAITDLLVTGQTTAAAFSWTAPTAYMGGSITNYHVYYKPYASPSTITAASNTAAVAVATSTAVTLSWTGSTSPSYDGAKDNRLDFIVVAVGPGALTSADSNIVQPWIC